MYLWGRAKYRYKKSWEQKELYRGWLNGEENDTRAYCLLCQSSMYADILIIRRHALDSINHQRRVKINNDLV